jgi:hypothetical protein
MMALRTIRMAAGPEYLAKTPAIRPAVGFEDLIMAADRGTR